jgi:ATP-dependent DNA helicase RecG
LQLSEIFQRSDRTKFKQTILEPLLEAGWLAMTHPDKPNSSKQKYVTTLQGKEILAQSREETLI